MLDGEAAACHADQNAVLSTENKALRKWLWIVHGCPVSALYGDDGEMQCANCGSDFKRDSVDKLAAAVSENNFARLRGLGVHAISDNSEGKQMSEVHWKRQTKNTVAEAVEKEQERWQERFDYVHDKYDVDGGGCESGDPLDVTDAEVRMAFSKLEEERDRFRAVLSEIEKTFGKDCGFYMNLAARALHDKVFGVEGE